MPRIECRECGALNHVADPEVGGNPNRPLADAGRPFVLAVAGGGSEVFGNLLRHGSMSGTLLLGHVLQEPAVTDRFLGFTPDSYASEWTARQLAVRSYQCAAVLRGAGAFGVGSTSSLRKPGGEREGRRHRAYVAYHRYHRTLVLSAALNEPRTREQEEAEVARLIDVVVRWGSGIFADARRPDSADEISVRYADAEPEGAYVRPLTVIRVEGDRGRFILSSSLNPIHGTHVAMMRWVYEAVGVPVDLELCVDNADKPSLDHIAVRERASATRAALAGDPAWSGSLHLTSAGLFSEKAKNFPGSVFLVGSDTIRRVADPDFYGGDEAMRIHMWAIYSSGCSFLVFNRVGSEVTRDELPTPLRDLVGFAGPSYRPTDDSSSRIREGVQ